MSGRKRHPLIFWAGITSLGTLANRVLGMIRDMATAALLGMSGSPVMDAFVVAFRIPNLFRRLVGEGALTAAMMPYTLLVCVAAQVAATLQCLSHFAIPALAPTLLNVCWLAAVWFIAPGMSTSDGVLNELT
jgi:putative peptidoglycan lipid II flippase